MTKQFKQSHFRGPVVGHALERKSEGGSPAAEVVTQFMTAFEEYKATNDSRLKAVEKKGAADPLLAEKLDRMDKFLDKFEGVSQKAVQGEKAAEALSEIKERFDRLETAMARSGKSGTEEKANRTGDWARAVVLANTVGIMNLSEVEQKVLNDIRAEYKALNVTTDSQGGYLAPVEFVNEILKGVTEISPARQLARVRQTANKMIQIPKRTGQFAARRIAEGATKTETAGLTYGMEELVAPETYAVVDITNDMLEDSAFDMESEIEFEASEQFAVREGLEFCVGTGVGEAEGILVNAGVGIVDTGLATDISADSLISLRAGVKSAYAANGMFLLNRQTIATVRKLKDSAGAYIWASGLAAGRPNTIDGDAYMEMPNMPAIGAGAFPVAYGDFKRGYTMLDRVAMEMLRDPYTQAMAGSVRFIFRRRQGGKVTMPEAIVKLRVQA